MTLRSPLCIFYLLHSKSGSSAIFRTSFHAKLRQPRYGTQIPLHLVHPVGVFRPRASYREVSCIEITKRRRWRGVLGLSGPKNCRKDEERRRVRCGPIKHFGGLKEISPRPALRLCFFYFPLRVAPYGTAQTARGKKISATEKWPRRDRL